MVVFENVNLSTNLNGFAIKNPILTASGTYGYANEFEIFYSPSELGAIVTKAITLKPRLGNNHERIFEVENGIINSIGLENVGIEAFIRDKVSVLEKKNINYIMNVAGATVDEYIEMASICENQKIKAIELNISCPNVKHGCLEFGTDKKAISELVKNIKNVYKGFLVVKLTPNVTSIEEIALAAQNAGANCISAINTVKGFGIKLIYDKKQKQFIKVSEVKGGLSGSAIKPIALGVVDRLYGVLDIPIIGIGGVYNFNDVLEFFAVGAKAVQIGTANFTNPNIGLDIVNQMKNFMIENEIKSVDELQEMLKKTRGN